MNDIIIKELELTIQMLRSQKNEKFSDRIKSLMAIYLEYRSRTGEEINVIISTLQEDNIFLKAEMLKRDKFVEKLFKDENLYRKERSIYFGLE